MNYPTSSQVGRNDDDDGLAGMCTFVLMNLNDSTYLKYFLIHISRILSVFKFK